MRLSVGLSTLHMDTSLARSSTPNKLITFACVGYCFLWLLTCCLLHYVRAGPFIIFSKLVFFLYFKLEDALDFYYIYIYVHSESYDLEKTKRMHEILLF